MAKLVIGVLIGAFVLFYVVNSPDHAASIADGAWHKTVSVAHGIGTFLNKLGS